MRLILDPEICQGHARCFSDYPHLFDGDDIGHGQLKVIGEVPTELIDDARRAAQGCPERAISLSE